MEQSGGICCKWRKSEREGVNVGRKTKIRRAIIDKDVEIPEDIQVGYDLDYDRRRGFTVTDSGIVIIAKGETSATFLRS